MERRIVIPVEVELVRKKKARILFSDGTSELCDSLESLFEGIRKSYEAAGLDPYDQESVRIRKEWRKSHASETKDEKFLVPESMVAAEKPAAAEEKPKPSGKRVPPENIRRAAPMKRPHDENNR